MDREHEEGSVSFRLKRPGPAPRGQEGHATHAEDTGGQRDGDDGRGRRRAEPGRAGAGGGAADAGGGARGRGGRLRGAVRGGARRAGARRGGAERPRAAAEGDGGSRDPGGAGAAGGRPAGGRRREADVPEPDPAAVRAAVAEGGRGAAAAVPARAVDRRLPAGALRAARGGRGRAVADGDRAADEGVGGGVRRVPAARPGGPGLRLRLGGRGPLQHPSRGRPALHPGHHRGAAGRHEGGDRRRGWVSREHRELADGAARPQAAGDAGPGRGGRRPRARLLGGGPGCLARDPGRDLLGPSDRQRAGQAADSGSSRRRSGRCTP